MSERRTTALKRLLTRPEIAFLMEAHSGLSARIVEEAGFEGVWGSGLTISAAFGVRDNNELSWSQVVDHVAFMTETTAIPLLLDGDTGYGNFNNMRRLVRKLEQVGVAGVTIEDKLFPKTNSFLRSELQPLADVEEFCGKIKAGKDSQTDADFVLVARVEALIAGWGLAEAIKRAEAYHRAGADAILIHSRQSSPAEIFAFLDEWSGRAPVVLVPTKYWRTPTEEFRARRVSVVIWANHVLRASISAMQATAARIRAAESLIDVEPHVAPLHDVFRLQGDEELQEAEKRYLPVARGASLSAIVLAAGAGITLVLDSTLAASATPDRVRAARPDSGRFEFDEVWLVGIGDAVAPAASHGVWVGLLHAGRDGAAWLREAIAAARADGTLRTARLSDLVTRVLAAGRPARVVYVRGGWVNVNNLTDLVDASGL